MTREEIEAAMQEVRKEAQAEIMAVIGKKDIGLGGIADELRRIRDLYVPRIEALEARLLADIGIPQPPA